MAIDLGTALAPPGSQLRAVMVHQVPTSIATVKITDSSAVLRVDLLKRSMQVPLSTLFSFRVLRKSRAG